MNPPRRTRHWLWILPLLLLLLLITGLGARDLTSDGLWYDEQWSIYDSGGAHYGPLSPAEIWTKNRQTKIPHSRPATRCCYRHGVH